MDKIVLLRRFFAISVGAFELRETIVKAFGGSGDISAMHKLHLLGKEEIEKDAPDMDKIDELLKKMEHLAEENSKENN